MKCNKWTKGLVAVGVISLASAAQAAESVLLSETASSTTLSGYVDTSAHWVPGSTPTTSAFAFGGLGAKDDGFNLNVVDLKLEKPLDEAEWAAGYKTELWFGPNANLIPGVANGLGTSSLGVTLQDFAIKQAYIALRVPLGTGLDIKFGVFDTPIGYESLNAGDNPNYTRSYGNSIEPTEHTGLLASYRFNDCISASVGIANTTDGIINGRAGGAQSQKTYMAAVALTAPDSFGFLKGATLYTGIVDGRPTGGFGPDKTWFYVGAAIPTPLENLALGISWDHVRIGERAGFSTRDTDSVAGYISYKATEKLAAHARLEWLHLGGDGNPGGADLLTGGLLNFQPGDVVVSGTLTVDYSLWKNVISRVEYRWDHDTGANGGNNFGGGTSNDDHLLALNLIYKF